MNGEKPREVKDEIKRTEPVADEIQPKKKRMTDLAPSEKQDQEEMSKAREKLKKIDKKEKLQAQQKTLSKIIKSGLPFLVFGGWAGKIEEVPGYSDEYYPRDIDVFLDQQALEDWQKFFEDNSFSIKKLKDKLSIIDQETGVSVDAHLIVESPRKDQWIEEVSHGTFYFPKEGFKTKQYGDQLITIMTPELWYHIEKNTPLPREEQETILKKLSKVIDPQALKEIEEKFDYSRKDKDS